MEILDRYIHQLLDQSTPESPIWYKEESDASAPAKWNYMDGCMIKAILELYHITENSRYLEFADQYNLDNVNAGKTLFDLYKLTGKEKYRKGIDTVHSQILGQPRTSTGNFWHKLIYPNQIWLDGLYMALPFYMQYEVEYKG